MRAQLRAHVQGLPVHGIWEQRLWLQLPHMAAWRSGFSSLRGEWISRTEGRRSGLKQVHSKFLSQDSSRYDPAWCFQNVLKQWFPDLKDFRDFRLQGTLRPSGAVGPTVQCECVCVCVHVGVHTRMCLCGLAHVCTGARACPPVCTCVSAWACARVCPGVWACPHVCAGVCPRGCVHVHVHVQVCGCPGSCSRAHRRVSRCARTRVCSSVSAWVCARLHMCAGVGSTLQREEREAKEPEQVPLTAFIRAVALDHFTYLAEKSNFTGVRRCLKEKEK